MILIDATPLVALCDGRHSCHDQAIHDLEDFATDSFATCEAVLTEACFHLPRREQRTRLRGLLVRLEVTPIPSMPDERYLDHVFDWLSRYAEQQPDWADGCLAVLSGRHPAARLWTYDQEFRTTWRRPDGTPIPLA